MLEKTSVLTALVCIIWIILSPVSFAQKELVGKHTYDETVRVAEYLFRMQPVTNWEQPVRGEAADFIEFVSDDRLLVGVIEVNRNGEPRHGRLYLVDATTGSVLWEHKRDNLSGGSYNLLLTEPLLLFGADHASARFTALDPASGREMWDTKVDAPYSVAIALEEQRLLVLFRDGSQWMLQALDVESGEQVWEWPLDENLAAESTPASVHVAGGSAYVFGRAIVEVNIADGVVVRTIDVPLLANDSGTALLLEDGVLAWDDHSVSFIDRSSGSVRWTSAVEATIQSVVVTGGAVVCVSGEQAEHTVLSLLDPTDGQARWSFDMAGPILSPVASDAGLLLFTTDTSLIGIDGTNGRAVFVRDLPHEMVMGSPSHAALIGLPDVLRTEAGVLFVSRERAGIAAFDLPAGTLRWYQRHYDANVPMLNYTADGRYAYVSQTLVHTGQAQEGVTVPPSLSSASRSSAAPLLAAAQRDYDAARSRYNALRGDPNASREQRRGALEGLRLAAEAQIIATEWDIITSRFSAGMDLAKSFISLAGAIGDIMRLKGAQGLRDRAQLSMQGALLAQHQLFQGDYYLRPFYVKGHGRGVTVVETGTGLRRDLIFSPHNTPSLAYGLDIPTFAVSPAGDRLVMFGISLRTERYERRGKWKTHVPNYSILSYDLGALVFVHHATVFTSVIDAIIGDESELVAWLLDRGGDVNERYPGSGETPLMYAAGSKPHMVSLLLQRGADVNAVSESGKTALDITPFRDVYDLLVASGGRSGSGEVPPPPSLDPPQLLLAITLNLPDRVRALVEGGEDVNLRNSQNETPLFYAAATDQLALVQLLLDFGADVNAVSDLGQTALDLAHSDPVRKTLRSAGGRLGSEVH